MVSMICKKGYTLQVINDGAGGYFKGMVDYRTGQVICRLTQVMPTKELAEKMPVYRQFYVKDNVYCGGTAGCFPYK